MKWISIFFIGWVVLMVFNEVLAHHPINHCLKQMNSHIINNNIAWLDECNLYDKDMPTVISYLKKHPNISQLYLLNNHISDKGAILLSRAKNLKMLELGNNQVNRAGMKALLHSSIKIIDLQGNKIDKAKLVALAQPNQSIIPIIIG